MRKLLASAAVLAAAVSVNVQAATLNLGDPWTNFTISGVGSPVVDDATGDQTYTFTLAAPAYFQVTDGYLDGDQFEFTFNGVSAGPTSTPTDDGDGADSFDEAFASPKFSHGNYLLAPDTYTVTGTALQSPYGGGGGGVRLVAAAPEAAGWAMMIAGFGVAGGALRRRGRARSIMA